MNSARFHNPHLRPIALKPVSRHEAFSYPEDEDGAAGSDATFDSKDQLELWKQLEKDLRASLHFEVPILENETEPDDRGSSHRKKRRKVAEKENESAVELLPALKLVSNLEAIPVSLQRGPWKPPKHYREPDFEDDEKSSQERQRRAQAVAVDMEWIVKESKIPYEPFPTSTPKVLNATTKTLLNSEYPSIAVLERLQPLRRTRPPVPRSELSHHPYREGAPPLEMETKGGIDLMRIEIG